MILKDLNKTTSILTLRVTSENDNSELTCRSSNPWFSGGAIDDKRIIRVACKYQQLIVCPFVTFYLFGQITDPPTVSVHLANEDPSRVVTRTEAQNVTLKCRADARPPVTSYAWFKNVSISIYF